MMNPFARIMKPWYVYKPWNVILRLFCKKPDFSTTKTIHMAWGGRLDFDIAKAIGWGAYTTGVVDLALSELICCLVKAGDSVLDIGANVGGITCLMSRVVGMGGSVEAFEPHPDIFKKLTSNVARNSKVAENVVRLHEIALSEQAGRTTLVEDPAAASDGQASIGEARQGFIVHEVPLGRLDKIVQDKQYSVMKLDVEGHELAVLKGAGALISGKQIKNILFEDHVGQDSDVCKFLVANGYFVYSFGWNLKGVTVIPINSGNLNNKFEAPNYWASSEYIPTPAFFPGWKSLREVGKN